MPMSENFQQLFVFSPQVYFYRKSATDFEFINVSENLQRVLGIVPASLYSADFDWLRQIDERDREDAVEKLRGSITGQPLVLRFRLWIGAGQFVWIEETGQSVILDGKPVYGGFWRNISDTVADEKELRTSRRLLYDAQEAANIGCYITDLQTGEWECTPVMDRIFGIGPDYPHNVERVCPKRWVPVRLRR